MSDIEKVLFALEVLPTNYVTLNGQAYYILSLASDLNAIRELELLVIEKVGGEAYWKALNYHAAGENIGLTERIIPMITADAKTRIAAMLAALEGLE
jgi:hypothetical protein